MKYEKLYLFQWLPTQLLFMTSDLNFGYVPPRKVTNGTHILICQVIFHKNQPFNLLCPPPPPLVNLLMLSSWPSGSPTNTTSQGRIQDFENLCVWGGGGGGRGNCCLISLISIRCSFLLLSIQIRRTFRIITNSSI